METLFTNNPQACYMLIISLAMRIYLFKRAFDRRSPYATEGFGGFGRYMVILILEWLGKWTANLLILLSLLLLLTGQHLKL